MASRRAPWMRIGCTGSSGSAAPTSSRLWIQPIGELPAPNSDRKGSVSRYFARSLRPTRISSPRPLHAPDLEFEKAPQRYRLLALEPDICARVAVRAPDGGAREVDTVQRPRGARHRHARQEQPLVRAAVARRTVRKRLLGEDRAGQVVGVHECVSNLLKNRHRAAPRPALPDPAGVGAGETHRVGDTDRGAVDAGVETERGLCRLEPHALDAHLGGRQ